MLLMKIYNLREYLIILQKWERVVIKLSDYNVIYGTPFHMFGNIPIGGIF